MTAGNDHVQSWPWVHFVWFDPAHPSADPTQPTTSGKIGPKPTQLSTTNNLTAWCNQILSNRALNALT